jgi:predicted deacylase
MKNSPIKICGVEVQPGERVTLALPTPEIYTCAPLHIPMHILHGRKEGPKLLICGTFHGDEVNGIAIIQRLLSGNLKNLCGTVIAVPAMSVYGLINHSRLLPDGHDLEASFPGSETGSFASRLAYTFTSEILDHCTHYLSIRTGGPERYKVPHVIYQKDDQNAYHLAKAFGSPIIESTTDQLGIFYHDPEKPRLPVLVYEGGEANRLDEWAVRVGVKGVTKILKELGMIRVKSSQKVFPPREVCQTTWIHAPGSGLFSLTKRVGSQVKKGEALGIVSDPFGTERQHQVIAQESGLIMEITTQPLVYEGQIIAQIGHYEEAVDPMLELPPIPPDIINN